MTMTDPLSRDEEFCRKLTHGSLCTGIGGIDLGFERAGFVTKFQVEIDEFCLAVLAKHWPSTTRYRDIRDCCGGMLRTDTDDLRCAECGRLYWLPYVDVLSAGFPCQPESLAGKRLGKNDERYLWPEVGRIIRDLRPRFALLENVPGILSGGNFGSILGDLAEVGYDCEWTCLAASSFGAEHKRERVFVVAYPNEARSQIWRSRGEDAANEGIFGAGLGFAFGTQTPGLERRGETRWRGDVHGIPRRVDRVKALGNAVVPQIAEWIGKRIIEVSK